MGSDPIFRLRSKGMFLLLVVSCLMTMMGLLFIFYIYIHLLYMNFEYAVKMYCI